MSPAAGPGGNRPRHGRPWYHLAALTTCDAKEIALSSADPNYDSSTDTYRLIYRGHDNASAVTNAEGLTVYFDPDTNEVLGWHATQGLEEIISSAWEAWQAGPRRIEVPAEG